MAGFIFNQLSAGAVNIPASESRTGTITAYATMPTPDQVTGIVLPTNGLIAVWYQATWQEQFTGQAAAAIFLGSNEVLAAKGDAAAPSAVAVSAGINAGAGAINKALVTYSLGLTCLGFGDSTVYTGDVTTGQVVGSSGNAAFLGGPCYIFAAASPPLAPYTVSVRFKAGVGNVTASNRKLWVQVLAFS